MNTNKTKLMNNMSEAKVNTVSVFVKKAAATQVTNLEDVISAFDADAAAVGTTIDEMVTPVKYSTLLCKGNVGPNLAEVEYIDKVLYTGKDGFQHIRWELKLVGFDYPVRLYDSLFVFINQVMVKDVNYVLERRTSDGVLHGLIKQTTEGFEAVPASDFRGQEVRTSRPALNEIRGLCSQLGVKTLECDTAKLPEQYHAKDIIQYNRVLNIPDDTVIQIIVLENVTVLEDETKKVYYEPCFIADLEDRVAAYGNSAKNCWKVDTFSNSSSFGADDKARIMDAFYTKLERLCK